MRNLFFVLAMIFSSFVHAQIYPLVQNGQVIHMKESSFYSENNYGGYTIKGCYIIYRAEKTNDKIILPLDMMIRYNIEAGRKVNVHTSTVTPFEPTNIENFVDGLMNHRYYCTNQYLLSR